MHNLAVKGQPITYSVSLQEFRTANNRTTKEPRKRAVIRTRAWLYATTTYRTLANPVFMRVQALERHRYTYYVIYRYMVKPIPHPIITAG
jgi:hypothetical protein